MAALGIMMYFLERFGFSAAPLVLGLILGPMAEQQFRRALAISQGDLTVFVTHPISLTLLLIGVLLVVVPVLLRRRRAASSPATDLAREAQ